MLHGQRGFQTAHDWLQLHQGTDFQCLQASPKSGDELLSFAGLIEKILVELQLCLQSLSCRACALLQSLYYAAGGACHSCGILVC